MVALGLNETCSYTLIPKDEVHKFTTDNFEEIYLADPMSEDRNTLRYSLLYSLKEIYLYNKARNNTNISIFEMGKGFYNDNGVYKEDLKLAGLMTGDYYLDINNSKVDFYIVKGIIENLLDYMGFNGRYSFVRSKVNDLHPGVQANIILDGKLIPENLNGAKLTPEKVNKKLIKMIKESSFYRGEVTKKFFRKYKKRTGYYNLHRKNRY